MNCTANVLRLEKAVQEAQQAGQQAVRAVQDKAHGEVQRLTRELEVLRDAQAGVVVEYEGRVGIVGVVVVVDCVCVCA